jgi:hypothetical protein
MNDDITGRVERGAALLDEKRPGWDGLIDLGRLDIQSSCNCVAGQLAGGSWAFSLTMESLELEDEEEFADHGFEADGNDHPTIEADYAALTVAWRDLITGRRAAAEVPA